jgi:acetyl-CoA synthetase
VSPRPSDPGALVPPRPTGGSTPNVVDYEQERTSFSWDTAAAALDGMPDGGLNIAHECVERHAAGAHRDHVALRFLRSGGATEETTYGELAARVACFAAVLERLGIARGERVFSLLGRVPEVYDVAMGTLRHGAVFCPLFAAFGPEPVRQRVDRGGGRVLVTTTSLYRRRVAPVREQLPQLRHVLLVDGGPDGTPGTQHLPTLLEEIDAVAAAAAPVAPTTADDLALLHFTSGTTGMPKGAMHVHGAVVAHHATGRMALDLHPDDIYWCTADPGWVTGTSYGIVAPLVHGVTTVVDEAELDPERWYRILEEQEVTVWYTAPTAVRMLMRAGDDLAEGADLSALRHMCSVGEPLDAEAVRWGARVLQTAIHDTWWQTETGGIMVANLPCLPIRPGSMGKPLPGVEVSLLARDDEGAVRLDGDGAPVPVQGPDEEGELAIRTGWPSMFRGYLHDEERYARCFAGGWYLSGDMVRMDADGYLWFVGRGDDLIKTSGHLIGPYEVEQVLMAHDAVIEAAVIGIPDEVAGNVIKAFVTLAPGWEPSDDLRLELVGYARSHLGPSVAPRHVAFQQDLPHTRSGKIMRRLLRARELGLAEGDLSTLEVKA